LRQWAGILVFGSGLGLLVKDMKRLSNLSAPNSSLAFALTYAQRALSDFIFAGTLLLCLAVHHFDEPRPKMSWSALQDRVEGVGRNYFFAATLQGHHFRTVFRLFIDPGS
jgi:hypothetical protein